MTGETVTARSRDAARFKDRVFLAPKFGPLKHTMMSSRNFR
jgi:hypothetical protein